MSLNLPRNFQEAIRSAFREWHQSWGHAYPHGDYTPAAPGNWDTTPTTIAGALDELAARIKALEP